MFCTVATLKNFPKLTRKNLSWSPFMRIFSERDIYTKHISDWFWNTKKILQVKKKFFYQYKKINCNMSNIATYTLPVFSIQYVMTMRNVYIIKIFEVCWHFTVLRSSNGLETFLIWLFPCYLYWVFKLFASSTFVTAYFWFVFQILIHVMQRKKM